MHGTGIKIIDSAASIGSHEMNTKYVSFPWPAVAAIHDCKSLAQTLHGIRSYWLQNNYPCAQDSAICIVSYHCLQTMRKINKVQGRNSLTCWNTFTITCFFPWSALCCIFPSSSSGNIIVAITEGN